MTSAVDKRGLEASPKFRVLLTASLVSSPYHVRLEHRSGLAIERSLEASFAEVVGDQRLRAQPVKVEADDVAARERSREQAGPLSVARLPRKVTPHRSPSYTPSPWPLGIAASADSRSCSSSVRPVAANAGPRQIEIPPGVDPHGIVSIAGGDWTVDDSVPIFNAEQKGVRECRVTGKAPKRSLS